MRRTLLLLCLAAWQVRGAMWVVSKTRRYTLCVTPKNGLTEVMEFVHWMERPAADICPSMLLPELQPEVRARKCEGYAPCGTLANFSACAIDYNSIKTPNLQIFDHGNPWADPCTLKPEDEECTSYARLAVGRDPLSRLLSAYRNKMEETFQNETLFQQNYLPKYSLDPKVPGITRYLQAVAATPDGEINIHFRSQSQQCYDLAGNNSRSFHFIADLNSPDDEDMDKLSAYMGAPQPWRSVISEHDVTNGAAAAVKKPFCWEGCRKHTALIEQLRERYADDVVRLRDHGLHDYNVSFNKMLVECRESDRVCNSLHDHGPWSRTSGSTAYAAQMRAAQQLSSGGGVSLAGRSPSGTAAAGRQGGTAAAVGFASVSAAAAAEGSASAEAVTAQGMREAKRKAFLQGALTPNS